MKISLIYPDRVSESKGGFLSHVDDVAEFDTLDEFAEIALGTHIAPGVFIENRKKQDCLQGIQFLCFDFDDGTITAEEVHNQLMHKVNHVILGSKNHLKDKGDGRGIIERFHVFIPTDKPIATPELYRYIYDKVSAFYRWDIDTNCKDAARYFYQHSQSLYVYDKSTPLTLGRFIVLQSLEEKTKKYVNQVFSSYDITTLAIIRFKNTKRYREMVGGCLRSDGNRYALSSSIIGVMKKCGLSQTEALALFDEHSLYGKSFTRQSVERRLTQFN